MKMIMIQENRDESVQRDVISLLNKLIPSGIWEHGNYSMNSIFLLADTPSTVNSYI